MNIRQALTAENSKRQATAIAGYIGEDPKRFAELMDVFFSGEYRLTQRAAWPLNFCAQRNSSLIFPYLDRLIDLLADNSAHDAVRRNIVRVMQFVDIPSELEGKAFDMCVNLVDDDTQAVAIRAFAMTVAARIAKDEPDLLNELRLIAEKHLPNATAAFRSRAKRILCI